MKYQRKKVEQVKNKNTSKALDKPDDRPHNEMTDKQSQDCLNMLENIYPEIYKELLSARNKFMGELKSG